MIGRLTGTLVERAPGAVLLDVGGVGYRVQIPLSTFYALDEAGNGRVSLHVHTYVREDALQLYGFATEREREAFERFLAVSGVGPRLALAVLSGIGVDDLERAVLEGDRARLERIPGIGRKTAERLLLELRDRFGEPAKGRRRRPAAGPVPADAPPEERLRRDAVSALVNLGYSADAADRAVESALADLGERATLEGALKGALSALVR